MTVNQEPPACSVAFAVAAIVGARVCGSPGSVKSRKWNPKRMLRGYCSVGSGVTTAPTMRPSGLCRRAVV